MAAVFISYRREDSEGHAGRLFSELSRYVGKKRVFMDVDSILPGQDYRQAIDRRLKKVDSMLALIGTRWLDIDPATKRRRLDNPDDFVRKEIAAALKRKIRVTPVLMMPAVLPTEEQLPDDLKDLISRQAFSLRHQRFEDDVKALAKGLGLSRRRWLRVVWGFLGIALFLFLVTHI